MQLVPFIRTALNPVILLLKVEGLLVAEREFR